MKKYYSAIAFAVLGIQLVIVSLICFGQLINIGKPHVGVGWLVLLLSICLMLVAGILLGMGSSRNLQNYLYSGQIVRIIAYRPNYKTAEFWVEVTPNERCYLYLDKGDRKDDYSKDDFVEGHYYRYWKGNFISLPIGK